MVKHTRITFQTEGDRSVGMFPFGVTVDVDAHLDQTDAEGLADFVAEYLDEGPINDLAVTYADGSLLTEVERLRGEGARLARLLDDANERAAQIEDWQIKCALLQVDRDKYRKALRTYGATHTWDCQSTHGTGLACDCGFDALMKEPTDGE